MKNKRLVTLIGSVCLVLVLAALPFMVACPAPAPPEEVSPKIGILYSKTGIYSFMGPDELDGILMALEDHGPVLGKTPELFIRDDGTDISIATAAARELITVRDVDFIITGDMNTPVGNAVAEVCDEYKIPFLYSSGGSAMMSGIGKAYTYPQGVIEPNPHPYTFYTWLNTVQRGFACVDVAKIYGAGWFFLASDYDHGREGVGFAQQYLQEEFGDKYVNLGEAWEKQGETDYTTAITRAIAAEPDVVFVLIPGRFVQFQKQAAALGLTDIAQIHWSYGERGSATAAGEAAYGLTSSVDYVVDNPDWPLANEFALRFYDRYGYWPGWPSSATYSGTQLMLMAVERAGSLDAVDIVRGFEGCENPNPINGKPFYMRACDHKSVQPLYTVQWVESDVYEPGYWKILAKVAEPDKGLLPCEWKANYDKMEY